MGDTTCKVVNTAFRSCIPVCCCIAAVVGHAHADEHAGSIAAVDPAVIEEIVVTAQRREQPRQSVPLTVDAISGIELTKLRVHDLEKLGRYLPNVDIKRAFGAVVPLISIRGVSLQDFNLINNPAVGVYLDDVYLASTGMLDFAIFDVERLEVIKGPQGTLYGRNTTGGAINVIPRKPRPGFEAFVRLDVGDYDLREFEGVINGGGETLAMRLSAFSRRQGEGFVRNRVTGNDIGEVSIDAVRGQIAWQPVDTFSLRLNVHAGRNESDAASYEHVSLLDPVTFDICEPIMQGRVDPFRCVDIMGYTDTDLDPYTGDYNLEPVIDNATSGAALTVNWRRGGLELTSITGFEEFDRFQQDQTDANPFVQGELLYDADIEQISQEFRLNSTGDDQITWIAGLYYSDDTVKGQPDVVLFLDDVLLTRVRIDLDQDTISRAVFGQLYWRIAPRWNVTLGLRYTDEERDYRAANIDLNPFGSSCLLPPFDCNPGATGPLVNASTVTSIGNHDWSSTIAIDFTPTDTLLMYARYSDSFKSGGFDAGAFLQEQFEPFGPESVSAWEAGVKSSLANDTVILNGAAFYYDFDDMQLFTVEEVGGLPITRVTNAGKSEIAGLDLDLTWQPADSTNIHVALGLLDTEIKEYLTDGSLDLSGNELPQSPRWSGSLGVRYRTGGKVGPQWTFSGELTHTDRNFNDIENIGYLAQRSITLLDARVDLASRDGTWNAALWVQNVTDKAYITTAGEGRPFVSYRAWGAPRTWGVSAAYRWQ